MTTYSYAGSFLFNGVATDGAIVNAYKASRFGSPPALNAAAPGGGADATTTTGTSAGFDGAFTLVLPTAEQYYIGITQSGVTFWQGPVNGVFQAYVDAADALLAPLASPALTGIPTVNSVPIGTPIDGGSSTSTSTVTIDGGASV